MPSAPPRRSRWRRRVAVLAIGLLVGLLVVEIVLRVMGAVLWPPLYELDAQLGWRHAPDVTRVLADEVGRPVEFRTDERGLRATPWSTTRADGTKRVVVVGDSFTAGSEVATEALFTRQLAEQLGDVEVWNAGVGGWSTLQELRLLETKLAQWRPDLVVLAIYDNDYADNLMPYYSGLGPRPYVTVRDGAVEVCDTPDVASFERFLMPLPGAFWCYEHCAIYRSLHKNVFLPRTGARLAALERAERDTLPKHDQEVAMHWLLERCAATVRAASARLLLVAIPTREEARAGRAARDRWLQTVASQFALPFHSTLAALHTEGPGAFFAVDIHLTAAGHACVARDLAPVITEQLRRRE